MSDTPPPVTLRERIKQWFRQQSATRNKIEELKDQLRDINAENEKLQQRISELHERIDKAKRQLNRE